MFDLEPEWRLSESPDYSHLKYDPDVIVGILEKTCSANVEMLSYYGFQDWFAEKQKKSEGGEFRFQGKLGFGGKFWYSPHSDRPMYVNCYNEDLNMERKAMIQSVNTRLQQYVDSLK